MKLFSSFCKFKLSKQFKLSNLIKHHKSSFTEKANTSEKENNSYSDTLKFMFESNILNKKLPCFEIYSSQVEILTQPMDFYLAIIVNIDVILKKLIKQAKERICISSLYLGTGKIEQFLVDELLKALQRKPNLKVTILLDHQRGLRLEKGENSLTMLSKIITETYPHSRNVKLAFFMNPRIGTIHQFLPSVCGEIAGVLHSKLLVFDNYTVITGANLSQNYFTNRQDRYYIIQDCEPFSDYCEDYVKALANVSYYSDNEGKLVSPLNFPDPIKQKVEYTNAILQQFKMFKYDNRVKIPTGYDLKMEEYFDNLAKFNNNYRTRASEEKLIEFSSSKNNFIQYLLDENKDKDLSFIKSFQSNDGNTSNREETTNNNPLVRRKNKKVLIFPSFQFYNIKQFDDQEILKSLLLSDNLFAKVKIASGYLNLPDFMMSCFKQAKYDLEVLTASPKANGFYKGGLLKKNIPYFYRCYERNMLRILQNKENFSLNEFHRDNWTFHTKGIWFYEKERTTPTMTVIGSSNFNYRSFERDVESQFYIYSFCERFSQRLEDEANESFMDSRKINLRDINKDKEIKLKLRHKIFSNIFRKYL